MKRNIFYWLTLLLLLPAVFAGCEKDKDKDKEEAIEYKLSFKVTEITVGLDMTYPLMPVLTPAKEDITYYYSSYNSDYVSVSDDGVVKGLKKTTKPVKVTVECKVNDKWLSAECMVSVADEVVKVKDKDGKQNFMYHMIVGSSVTLYAEMEKMHPSQYEWVVQDPSILSVDYSGNQCTITGLKAGETRITVTADGGAGTTIFFTVENPLSICKDGKDISGQTLNLKRGDKVILTNGSGDECHWLVANDTVIGVSGSSNFSRELTAKYEGTSKLTITNIAGAVSITVNVAYEPLVLGYVYIGDVVENPQQNHTITHNKLPKEVSAKIVYDPNGIVKAASSNNIQLNKKVGNALIRYTHRSDWGQSTADIMIDIAGGEFRLEESGTSYVFAPFNLRYNPATGKYKFQDEQPIHNGTNNGAWTYGTAFNAYGDHMTAQQANGVENNTVADGIARGGTYPANVWRLPTEDEWDYLVRTENYSHIGLATVTNSNGNNRAGVLLLPKDWVVPAGLSAIKKIQSPLSKSSFTDNVYTNAQWLKMEAAGAIFLPSCGYITQNNEYKLRTEYPEYWSSTASSEYVWKYFTMEMK